MFDLNETSILGHKEDNNRIYVFCNKVSISHQEWLEKK